MGARFEQWLVAVSVGAALAACHSVCPKGATLRGSPPPTGAAQWCEGSGPAVLSSVPVPGRGYQAALGIARPTARSRSIEGPQIEWHPSGSVASYGRFSRGSGDRSVPHGVFTVWHQDGRRHTQVTYEMGRPVGCAGLWDDTGELRTGLVQEDRFRAAPCDLTIDEEATGIAAARGFPSSSGPAVAALDIGTLLSPADYPFASEELPPVSFDHNVRLGFTYPLGPVAIGLAAQWWSTEDRRRALSVAPLVAWSAPTPLSRLRLLASAELGARRYSTRARIGPRSATEWDHVPSLYGALTGGLALQLSRTFSLQLSGMLTHDLEREVTVTSLYCAYDCVEAEMVWNVGGSLFGALVQAQVQIH